MNSDVKSLDESYWLDQIELQAKSQLSKTVCQIKKISYNQFVYGSKKLTKKQASALVPVQIRSELIHIIILHLIRQPTPPLSIFLAE